MRTLRRLGACSSLLLLAGPLPARDVELVPQIGGRFGGELTDEATNRDVSLDSDAVFGLAVDVALAGEGRHLRLSWSRERTEAELPDPARSPQRLVIDTLHLGGVYRWRRETVEPYLTAGIGLTAIDADDREVFPSASLGAGARWPIRERLALWLEGRGVATLETGAGRLACGGGCELSLSGGGFFRLEVLVGLSVGL